MSTRRNHNRRPHTEADRAERRERERRLMADAVEQLQSSEGWRRWLGLRRHFHRYSLRNQILIAQQMPEATRVAGFKAWLDIGYAVRKGEHGISIYAPCPPSRRRMREWQESGSDPKTKPRTFFRMVAVFDRSQVAPLPDFPGGAVALDPPGQPVSGDSLAWLFRPLCDFGELIGSPIRIESGASEGSYDRRDGRIRVDPVAEGFTPNAQVAVAIHELAHALVDRERRDDDPALDYGEEEVVVECVAYCVCSSVGLDTSGSAVPYVARWGSAADIERYAALVDRLARRIEDAVLAVSPPAYAEDSRALAAH